MGDYYSEKKYCEHCKEYVNYLMSAQRSYCTRCGNVVRLFSHDDARKFTENVQRHRWQAS